MTKLVTQQDARDALDSLDDFARMDCGVDAVGPRGVLERFIEQAGVQKDEPIPPMVGPAFTGYGDLNGLLNDLEALKQEATLRGNDLRADDLTRAQAQAAAGAYAYCQLRLQQQP